MGEIGRGGMRVVYLTENKLTARKEVLKVASRDLMDRRGVLDRFMREIRNAMQLHHPNIVSAYNAFRAGETIVYAMEYIEGHNLASYVETQDPCQWHRPPILSTRRRWAAPCRAEFHRPLA
jgi:serine/threonine protein kinase